MVERNETQMSDVNFQRVYQLGDEYTSIKERATRELHKYLEYPDLITFSDLGRSVTFTSERLIPVTTTNRPRIMLLFSNPHPNSVHQGMFLSPNTRGRQNPFWPVMESAGWLSIPGTSSSPEQLADICLKAKYQGPFELIFYCYYAFPTDYPEDIQKIFGKEYFNQIIAPEAIKEFRKTVQENSIEAVITFNKGVFNLVSENPVEQYIKRLIKGELIRSQVKDIERSAPIILTFPTGWRYHKDYRQLRKVSLDIIRTAICRRSNTPEIRNR